MNDFRSYETVEDLLSDRSFIEYCSGKDAMTTRQWEAWMHKFPERRSLVLQAKQVLIAAIVEMDDEQSSAERLRASLAQETVLPAISVTRSKDEKRKGGNHFLLLKLGAAASLLVLLACMILLRPPGTTEKYLQVRADKVLSLYLPDSTLMVLNKGTSVRYPADYSEKGSVFIEEGEVFFKVSGTPGTSLTVVTATGLKVEDIGTEFSVKSYKGLLEEAIQVQEGMVDVYRKGAAPARLSRNQALRVNKNSGELTLSKADRLSTSGWTTGAIALYDVRFDEVAAALARTFDKKVILADPALAELRVTILFKAEQELEDIMKTLSTIYNLTVSYENNHITLAGN